MSAQIITIPPRGHYVAHEVGQLAGVSGGTVGQWAHYGYIRASQSKPGEYPRIYSFQDVAEAIIVHELLDTKVPSTVLRPVIERLRAEFGDWPLQRAQLETLTQPEIRSLHCWSRMASCAVSSVLMDGSSFSRHP